MALTPPSFWYPPFTRQERIQSTLLLPLSWIYYGAHYLHQALGKGWKAPVPVICVGNLTVGGTGKTPTALALCALLKENGLAANPYFISRGYGGRLNGPVRVRPARHNAADVGDEPLLLAEAAPTVVARDRKNGIAFAAAEGADLIIMDDGLQNPAVEKTLRLVVIDATCGFGNGRMLPAGPMRTRLRDGLQMADAFILIGDDTADIAKSLPADKPLIKARFAIPKDWKPADDKRYVGFCGIGRPDKMRESAESYGLELVGWHAFPDHHPYGEEELATLAKDAADKNARLLTTAKDAVRLPASFTRHNPVDILPVRLAWENESDLADLLKTRM